MIPGNDPGSFPLFGAAARHAARMSDRDAQDRAKRFATAAAQTGPTEADLRELDANRDVETAVRDAIEAFTNEEWPNLGDEAAAIYKGYLLA